MKSKASLLLMEQLVMLLVFALAATVCLQIFAKADAVSREVSQMDKAVTMAQNAAEVLKATKGDISAAEELAENGYQLMIRKQESSLSGLGLAEIQVYFDETVLFSLNAGWQEEMP